MVISYMTCSRSQLITGKDLGFESRSPDHRPAVLLTSLLEDKIGGSPRPLSQYLLWCHLPGGCPVSTAQEGLVSSLTHHAFADVLLYLGGPERKRTPR